MDTGKVTFCMPQVFSVFRVNAQIFPVQRAMFKELCRIIPDDVNDLANLIMQLCTSVSVGMMPLGCQDVTKTLV